MIRYLLDTNIASLFIRNGNAALMFRMQTVSAGELAVSTVTEAELRFGLALLPPEANLHRAVEDFLRGIAILPWNSPCARAYGSLAARQQKIGKPLATADAMIAAHAVAYGLTVVSNDAVFQFVEDLKLQDWTKGPQRT
jgi:tRNA(fMet)-specific endonuclease VapC